MRQARLLGALDTEEAVALIARARRSALLGIHRHNLGRQDLEDCYSQATLEMLTRARGGGAFASRAHIANSLELRFVSRIHDRRRALNGRSPMEAELARAIPLSTSTETETNLHDPRADIERKILARHELRRIAEISHKLSPDQRLLLASRLSDTDRADFCQAHGWSVEKYRKVSQRAGARLRQLVDEDSRSVSTEPGPPALSRAASRARKKSRPPLSPFSPPVGTDSRDPLMTSSRPPHKRVPRIAGDLPSGRSAGTVWIGRARVLHRPHPADSAELGTDA